MCEGVLSQVTFTFPDPNAQAERHKDPEGWHAAQEGGEDYFLRGEIIGE